MRLTVTVATSNKQANGKIQIHTRYYISKPIIVRIVADIAAKLVLKDRGSGPRLRVRPIRDALCSL